jgi:hypothetical protein
VDGVAEHKYQDQQDHPPAAGAKEPAHHADEDTEVLRLRAIGWPLFPLSIVGRDLFNRSF